MDVTRTNLVRHYVLLLTLLLASCGGGGSSSSDSPDSGNNPDNNNGQGFTITPLNALPPLSERLYGGVEYGARISGPKIGKGELTNDQIFHQVSLEETHGFSGIVMEEAYLLNEVDPSDTVKTARPMQFMSVATNVSNATICNLKFSDVSFVRDNGEVLEWAVMAFRGYNSVEFNSDALKRADSYSTDCLPAGKSAYVFNAVQFDSTLVGGPSSAQEFEKVVFNKIEGSVTTDTIIDFSGLSANAYIPTNRGSGFDFYLSITNSSDRNLNLLEFEGGNVVFFINPDTGKPLGYSFFAGFARNTDEYPELAEFGNVFSPGAQTSNTFFLNSIFFRGSTNTIIATFDWVDNDRTGLQGQ